MPFRSGFVSIIGRPNVGKSTLLNTILGRKIAIVSNKPQTTRKRLTGVKHLQSGQIIFIDTPGMHQRKGLLYEYMTKVASRTLREVDVILLVVDVVKGAIEDDLLVMDNFKDMSTPVLLCINKIDIIKKDRLLPLIDKLSELKLFRDIFPVSAAKNRGVTELIDSILKTLPEGPVYFPGDYITDAPERLLVEEAIREKVFLYTGREVPYSVAVSVNLFNKKARHNLVSIVATIYVERMSQKGIIIGKSGGRLKRIGCDSRKDIECLLDSRVYLDLRVSIKKNWTNDMAKLREFGYFLKRMKEKH